MAYAENIPTRGYIVGTLRLLEAAFSVVPPLGLTLTGASYAPM